MKLASTDNFKLICFAICLKTVSSKKDNRLGIKNIYYNKENNDIKQPKNEKKKKYN